MKVEILVACAAAAFAVGACTQQKQPKTAASGESDAAGVAPGDTARAPATPGPAQSAGQQIGRQIDDSVITTKVKAALLDAFELKGFKITVNTEKAVVQLSGFVDSQQQIDRAAEIARGVEGVRSVQNRLSLKPV